jgi:hypothetical protein
MNTPVETLRSALQCLSRDDLDDLTVEELDRLECDLQAWANIVMVKSMDRRIAARGELPE